MTSKVSKTFLAVESVKLQIVSDEEESLRSSNELRAILECLNRTCTVKLVDINSNSCSTNFEIENFAHPRITEVFTKLPEKKSKCLNAICKIEPYEDDLEFFQLTDNGSSMSCVDFVNEKFKKENPEMNESLADVNVDEIERSEFSTIPQFVRKKKRLRKTHWYDERMKIRKRNSQPNISSKTLPKVSTGEYSNSDSNKNLQLNKNQKETSAVVESPRQVGVYQLRYPRNSDQSKNLTWYYSDESTPAKTKIMSDDELTDCYLSPDSDSDSECNFQLSKIRKKTNTGAKRSRPVGISQLSYPNRDADVNSSTPTAKYVCRICGQHFHSLPRYRKHFEIRHMSLPVEEMFDVPYKCQSCSSVFDKAYRLEIHWNFVHNKDKIQTDATRTSEKFDDIFEDIIKIPNSTFSETLKEICQSEKETKLNCSGDEPCTIENYLKTDESCPNHFGEVVTKVASNIATCVVKEKRVHTCRVCKVQCRNLTAYRAHFVRWHPNRSKAEMFDTAYKCTVCSAVFDNETRLRVHLNFVHREVDCSADCNFGKSSVHRFEIIPNDTNLETTDSTFCSESLPIHENDNGETSAVNVSTTFSVDKKQDDGKPLYLNWENLTPSRKGHECRVCGREFFTLKHYRLHFDRWHPNYPKTEMFDISYQCKSCPSVFDSESRLNSHWYCVHRDDPEPDVSDDQTTGINLYEICQKLIEEESQRKIPKYICRICQRQIVSLKKYHKHFENCHKNRSKEEMFDKVWKCTFCTEVYNSEERFREHWNSVHKNEENFESGFEIIVNVAADATNESFQS